jgi:hypothetical protein
MQLILFKKMILSSEWLGQSPPSKTHIIDGLQYYRAVVKEEQTTRKHKQAHDRVANIFVFQVV